MKKQYIQPSASVYQVSTCEVICGSGDTNTSLGNGNQNPGFTNGSPIGGEAAQRRNGWDDYENL